MQADAAATQNVADSLPSPVIILGTCSTASAMVGAMLGCNPAAFSVPELNLFVADTLEGVVTAMANPGHTHMHGLLRTLAYIYGSEQTILSVGLARRWIVRRLSWPTSRIFDELRQQVAPLRLIDKSPAYAHDAACVSRILKNSPDARFVHVVKHPLAGSAAVDPHRRGAPRRALANRREYQTQWLEEQNRISRAVKNVPAEQLALLRVEDLIDDPHAELARLCAHLDLPSDERALMRMLHPENSPFAGPGPVGAAFGDDRVFLQDPMFPPKALVQAGISVQRSTERMLPDVAAAAARYGYIAR
jgi:hypothetical protein